MVSCLSPRETAPCPEPRLRARDRRCGQWEAGLPWASRGFNRSPGRAARSLAGSEAAFGRTPAASGTRPAPSLLLFLLPPARCPLRPVCSDVSRHGGVLPSQALCDPAPPRRAAAGSTVLQSAQLSILPILHLLLCPLSSSARVYSLRRQGPPRTLIPHWSEPRHPAPVACALWFLRAFVRPVFAEQSPSAGRGRGQHTRGPVLKACVRGRSWGRWKELVSVCQS